MDAGGVGGGGRGVGFVVVEEGEEDGVVASEEQNGGEKSVADLEDVDVGVESGVDEATVSAGVLDEVVDAAEGLFFFVDLLEELLDLSPKLEDCFVSFLLSGKGPDVGDLLVTSPFQLKRFGQRGF